MSDPTQLPVPLCEYPLTEIPVPDCIANQGAAGQFAWEEYFAGKLRNPHTRKAYLQAVTAFLDWCQHYGVELQSITPGLIGRYFDQHPGSAPTKKQHMSAIRGLFQILVQRHVVVLNPALSVTTERFSVWEGKTPDISVEQVRCLKACIRLESVVDYRDRAIISLLIYTAARVGAIAKLRLGDLVDEGQSLSIRFREKGGRHRSIPARIDLRQELEDYLQLSRPTQASKDTPLFPTAPGRSSVLGDQPMSPGDMGRMLKRRLRQAGLPISLSCHSFRSCAATDLLSQGVPLEDVQYLLGHADSRVTRLYDRRQRAVTRNIVERISV